MKKMKIGKFGEKLVENWRNHQIDDIPNEKVGKHQAKRSVFLRIQAAACKFFPRTVSVISRTHVFEEVYSKLWLFKIKFSGLMRLLIGGRLLLEEIR